MISAGSKKLDFALAKSRLYERAMAWCLPVTSWIVFKKYMCISIYIQNMLFIQMKQVEKYDPFIMRRQYQCYWWPSVARSYVINIHDVHLVSSKYSGPNTRISIESRLKWCVLKISRFGKHIFNYIHNNMTRTFYVFCWFNCIHSSGEIFYRFNYGEILKLYTFHITS